MRAYLRSSLSTSQLIRWIVLLGIPLLFFAACDQVGGLRPIRPTVLPNQIISSQPQLITFTELEADPSAYEDKLIRVTGAYVELPVVSCAPYSGPNTAWALVADELRLDILGFEGLLNQLDLGDINLTLDGVLRRYDGPLGCGKRPETGVLWYLEAIQIIQPNPLVQVGTGGSGDQSVIPPPFPTGTPPEPEEQATPEEEATTGAGTPTRTPTSTSPAVATASSTPTLSPTPDETVPSQGSPTVTRTPTQTPTPTQTTTAGGTATSTPTPSQTPSSGPTSAPLPTSTPGGNGYPGNPTQTPAYP